MAQTGLRFVCKSCRQQLQQVRTQSRTFTSTPQRAKTIPSFTPTSSPELDDILLTYRKKVFTPYALQQYHRDLIYKPSRHQLLLNDPGVTVTLSDDEEVKLMPMHPHDKPTNSKSLKRLIELLEDSSEPKDWNNLPAFLEGMVMAKERLPDGWLEKVVRKANERGRTGVVIRCAEMVKKTGVTLADSPITTELMLGFHMRAVQSGWESEEAQKATKQAEQVGLMMEDAEHCGGKLKEGQQDMRRDLTVVGVLLELTAAQALHRNDGKDIDGKVMRNLRNLLALSRSASFQPGGTGLTRRLEGWLPLRAGLRMALKVEGIQQSDQRKDAQDQLKTLDDVVNKIQYLIEKQAGGKPRRALSMLKDLEAM